MHTTDWAKLAPLDDHRHILLYISKIDYRICRFGYLYGYRCIILLIAKKTLS